LSGSASTIPRHLAIDLYVTALKMLASALSSYVRTSLLALQYTANVA